METKLNAKDDSTINLTDLKARIAESERPLLVDFWGPWCGNCKLMRPSVTRLSKEFDGKLDVIFLNMDVHPEAAEQYDIVGLPVIAIFRGGKETARVSGLNNYEALRRLIETHALS